MAKKNAYEKMEVLLEEIMNEPNIDQKIADMEKEVALKDQVKDAELKGPVKDAEYYKQKRQQGKKSLEQHKKEMEQQKQEEQKKKQKQEQEEQNKKREKAALEKKLKFYKAFKQNKNQIFNIREYQLALQEKLERLEQEMKEVTQFTSGTDKIENEIAKIEREMQEILAKKHEISQELKSPNLSDEQRAKLTKEDKEIEMKLTLNQSLFVDAQKRKQELGQEQNQKSTHRSIEQISDDIVNTKIKISKCNVVWSSLLKGKNWNEINAILEKGDYTAEKGTFAKIKKLSQKSDPEKLEPTESKDKQHVQKLTDKQVRNIGDSQQDQSTQKNLPEISKTSFKDRHPRLGKIPFLGKIVDKITSIRNKTKEEIEQEEKNPKQDQNPTESKAKQKEPNINDEKVLAYIDKHEDSITWQKISAKGYREAMKADLDERHKANKQTAADNYAQQYGGRYTEQDGANNDKGMEPGD